jgi:hypothetical protein
MGVARHQNDVFEEVWSNLSQLHGYKSPQSPSNHRHPFQFKLLTEQFDICGKILDSIDLIIESRLAKPA